MEASPNFDVPTPVKEYCNYVPTVRVIQLEDYVLKLKLRLMYFHMSGRTLQYQGFISESELLKRISWSMKIFDGLPDDIDKLTHWLMKMLCTTAEEFVWLECCEADCMKLRLGYPGKSFNQNAWLAGRKYMNQHLRVICSNRVKCAELDDDEQLLELRKRCRLGNFAPRIDAFLDQPVNFSDLKLPPDHLQAVHADLLVGKPVPIHKKLELLSQLNRAGMNLDSLRRALMASSANGPDPSQLLTAAYNCNPPTQMELAWQRALLKGFQDQRCTIFSSL